MYLLIVAPKLVVIHQAPAQSSNDVYLVLIDGLEHLCIEALIVLGPFVVIALRIDGLRRSECS